MYSKYRPISVPNTTPSQAWPVTNNSVSAAVRSTTCVEIKTKRQAYTTRRLTGFDGTKP